ncbi:MAG: hypothetical protein V1896_02285 [Candidatus Zambryskibacteria bacterium]
MFYIERDFHRLLGVAKLPDWLPKEGDLLQIRLFDETRVQVTVILESRVLARSVCREGSHREYFCFFVPTFGHLSSNPPVLEISVDTRPDSIFYEDRESSKRIISRENESTHRKARKSFPWRCKISLGKNPVHGIPFEANYLARVLNEKGEIFQPPKA